MGLYEKTTDASLIRRCLNLQSAYRVCVSYQLAAHLAFTQAVDNSPPQIYTKLFDVLDFMVPVTKVFAG